MHPQSKGRKEPRGSARTRRPSPPSNFEVEALLSHPCYYYLSIPFHLYKRFTLKLSSRVPGLKLPPKMSAIQGCRRPSLVRRVRLSQCSGAAYCCRRLVLFPTSHSQIARPVAVRPVCSNCLRKVPTSMSCLRKNGTSLERRLCCVQATTGKLKLSQYCSRTVDLHHTLNLGSAYSCAAMHWYVAWDLPDRERVQANARREVRQLIDDFENREG